MMLVLLAESTFAAWLADEMRRKGFDENQSKLATYIGTRSSTVNAWFTRGAKPSPALARDLAKALKVPVEEVLRRAGHLPAEGDEPPQPDQPDWVTLIPALTPEDAAYIGRLVESLAQRPVHPQEGSAPGGQ